VDKPIAGLLADLKRRGMLDETLVVWHTEFGRMPISQRGVGRDHNPNAFSIGWRAAAFGGQIIAAAMTSIQGYRAPYRFSISTPLSCICSDRP